MSESYVVECASTGYFSDRETVDQNAGILMVPSDVNRTHYSQQHEQQVDSRDADDSISCSSFVNSRNSANLQSDILEVVQRLSINSKSGEVCSTHPTPPEVRKMCYRHPPPYPEQVIGEKNIQNPLEKYRHPPPYREPLGSVASTEGSTLNFTSDFSTFYNLEASYKHPPSYVVPPRNSESGFLQDNRVSKEPPRKKPDKKAMVGSYLFQEEYSHRECLSNQVPDYYNSKGMYNSCSSVPFSSAQDSFSYSLPYGDPLLSEVNSHPFGYYVEQATSTNNLFSESESEVFGYGAHHSPHSSGGSHSAISMPRTQTVSSPKDSMAGCQPGCSVSGFSSYNMNEERNLGTWFVYFCNTDLRCWILSGISAGIHVSHPRSPACNVAVISQYSLISLGKILPRSLCISS